MRILFDAYWWASGPISNRIILREIVFAWVRQFPDDQISLLVKGARSQRLAESELPSAVQVHKTSVWPHALAAMLVAGSMSQLYKSEAVITHNFSPLVGKMRCTFVHDMLFCDHPEWFTRVERAYLGLIPLAAKRADLIFTSTVNESNRIARRRCAAERPTPTGFGLSNELLTSPELPVEGLAPGRFVLTVARLNVRKNLRSVITGAVASGCLSPGYPLAIVGESSGRSDALTWRERQWTAEGLIRFLGSVSSGQLRWLYRHASAFIYLALDEGFGLPPVEAAAMGCPVIVSDRPVFKETLGSSAVRVDPLDVYAIARALSTLIAHVNMSPSQPAPGEGDYIPTPGLVPWSTVVGIMRNAILKHRLLNSFRCPESANKRVRLPRAHGCKKTTLEAKDGFPARPPRLTGTS